MVVRNITITQTKQPARLRQNAGVLRGRNHKNSVYGRAPFGIDGGVVRSCTGPAAGAKGPLRCPRSWRRRRSLRRAHSTTRALYASYRGSLYQVLRQSDGEKSGHRGRGGVGNRRGRLCQCRAQDAFCANTTCWISKIYDQSPKHNDLFQAPRGAFSGPAMGGFNNLPLADMAPVTVIGHKVYGVFIARAWAFALTIPGAPRSMTWPPGPILGDQRPALHFVRLFLYTAMPKSTARTTAMADGDHLLRQLHRLVSRRGPWSLDNDRPGKQPGRLRQQGSTSNSVPACPSISWRFVTAMARYRTTRWASLGGDAQRGPHRSCSTGRASTSLMIPCASRAQSCWAMAATTASHRKALFMKAR